MVEEPRDSISIYDQKVAEKFVGYSPGDIVSFEADVEIDTIGLTYLSFKVRDIQILGDARTFAEASRRAKNEVTVRNRIEPSIS